MGTISSQGGHKRSPWDSLPSLCKDNSLNDSGYKSARADSLEHRYILCVPFCFLSFLVLKGDWFCYFDVLVLCFWIVLY